jgi:hypothetical protein
MQRLNIESRAKIIWAKAILACLNLFSLPSGQAVRHNRLQPTGKRRISNVNKAEHCHNDSKNTELLDIFKFVAFLLPHEREFEMQLIPDGLIP